MSVLEGWLFDATRVLMVPVVAALVAAMVFALLWFGGFLRELLERRQALARWRAAAGGFADRSRPTPQRLAAFVERNDWPGMLARLARSLRGGALDDERVQGTAASCEVEISRRVSRLNLVARAGPTLGLMATLIPMGPALLALAENDVAGLARALVVAFSATVVGLLVGLLCSTMGSVRRHWYAADLAAFDECFAPAEVRS